MALIFPGIRVGARLCIIDAPAMGMQSKHQDAVVEVIRQGHHSWHVTVEDHDQGYVICEEWLEEGYLLPMN